jgi:hypothetical protein
MESKTNKRSLGVALHHLFLAVALVGVTALITGRAMSDDKKQPNGEGPENEMMGKWVAAGTPGEFHKKLDAFVGNWKGVSKFWMDPSQEPEASEATMTVTWILGGRFLKQEYKGEVMGQPFEGLGLWGYDNLKKKYTASWADNMTTAIMSELGTCDASGKTFTLIGSHDDPMTGKAVAVKSITRIINKDKHVLEMYEPGPDGKMFKNLEITYTRK